MVLNILAAVFKGRLLERKDQVPENCFSNAKLFPEEQSLSGSIVSDLNVLLGHKFESNMKLYSILYCERQGT
jgi:hypothetical protein